MHTHTRAFKTWMRSRFCYNAQASNYKSYSNHKFWIVHDHVTRGKSHTHTLFLQNTFISYSTKIKVSTKGKRACMHIECKHIERASERIFCWISESWLLISIFFKEGKTFDIFLQFRPNYGQFVQLENVANFCPSLCFSICFCSQYIIEIIKTSLLVLANDEHAFEMMNNFLLTCMYFNISVSPLNALLL